MEVTYPDGRTETLLNVPAYSFNWQITYRAADPIFIPKRHAAEDRRTFRQLAKQPDESQSGDGSPLGLGQRNRDDGRLGRVRGCRAPDLDCNTNRVITRLG